MAAPRGAGEARFIFGIISEIEYNKRRTPVVRKPFAGGARFPSLNGLRANFAEARYIVDQDTIRQVYVAGVGQKPILIEGPPGCGEMELAKAVTFALDTKLERLQCCPGIDEEKAIGRFDTALQKLFLRLARDRMGVHPSAPACAGRFCPQTP